MKNNYKHLYSSNFNDGKKNTKTFLKQQKLGKNKEAVCHMPVFEMTPDALSQAQQS